VSVGGRLIEIRPMSVATDRGARRQVVRLWAVDRDGNETCVYAEPTSGPMPGLGEEIWWQSGKIYFDRERQHLVKVGASFTPRPDETINAGRQEG
jgi:hypothetical protein